MSKLAQRFRRPREERMAWVLLALYYGYLTTTFFLAVYSHLRDNMWLDPFMHNTASHPALAFRTVALRTTEQHQPMLEYLIRHYLWFPLLGFNEFSVKLPSAVYSLFTVAACAGICFYYFRRKLESPLLAAVFSGAFGCWLTENASFLRYSYEPRHYALVILASTCWFALQSLYEGKSRWLYYLATFLFLNTHFFTIPLVTLAFCLTIFRHTILGRYRKALLELTALATLVGLAVYFNHGGLTQLLHSPAAPHAPISWKLAWERGIDVYGGLYRTLHFPGFLLFSLGAALEIIRTRRGAFLPLTQFVLLPFFFAYMRYRSHQGFNERYYLPFFGLALANYGLGLAFAWRMLLLGLKRWCPLARAPISGQATRAAFALALITILLLRHPAGDWYTQAKRWREVSFPGWNFTADYEDALRVSRLKGPLLQVVHGSPWDYIFRTEFYLARILKVVPMPISLSYTNRWRGAEQKLSSFIRHNPKASVLLDRDRRLGPCGPSSVEVPAHLIVEDLNSPGHCLLVVRGARDSSDVALIAASIDLPIEWLSTPAKTL